MIIAHRGASGLYPEHTYLSHSRAVHLGADYIECDVVMTKDLVLICSHEPWIGLVSNVADTSLGGPARPDFSDRYRSLVLCQFVFA